MNSRDHPAVGLARGEESAGFPREGILNTVAKVESWTGKIDKNMLVAKPMQKTLLDEVLRCGTEDPNNPYQPLPPPRRRRFVQAFDAK